MRIPEMVRGRNREMDGSGERAIGIKIAEIAKIG
jgi:hypothetical protein